MTNSQTGVLDRTDGRIAYDVSGSGPLVVLVPGMGELRSTWRFVAPALVADGYRVVTFDLRGHGESDATFPRYGDEETASDVVALIELLGGPAVIVGNSLGAAVGVLIAADRPELVTGLALLGPFVRNPRINPVMSALFRVITLPLWVAPVWKSYLPSLYAGRKPADFADYLANLIAAMKRPGYRRSFSLTTKTSHAASEAALSRVHTRVLVLMGALDPDFPNQEAEAHWIVERVGGRVVMVEDAGHYPQSQRPDIVVPELESFLAEVTTRA